MSSAIFSLPELYASYKSWVSKNPQTASDLETTIKWISYFIAGRLNNSHILSELIYSLSNLLVLFNDRIITKSQNSEPFLPQDQLKVWLTVLEYCEVFFELSSVKLWGTKGKWIVIMCLQLFKCLSRLMLVFRYKENVIQQPPVPALKRKNMEMTPFGEGSLISADSSAYNSISFTLGNSGMIIRRVNSSPPINYRNWKPPERNGCDRKLIQKELLDKQLVAECLYILKPVIHLVSAAYFGINTWKPWMISLVLDLYSLHLYITCRRIDFTSLTSKQKLQISRRIITLILYLLRSPFYDRFSKNPLNLILQGMTAKVPLAHLICNPLMMYIPFCQKTYFYMWST